MDTFLTISAILLKGLNYIESGPLNFKMKPSLPQVTIIISSPIFLLRVVDSRMIVEFGRSIESLGADLAFVLEPLDLRIQRLCDQIWWYLHEISTLDFVW